MAIDSKHGQVPEVEAVRESDSEGEGPYELREHKRPPWWSYFWVRTFFLRDFGNTLKSLFTPLTFS